MKIRLFLLLSLSGVLLASACAPATTEVAEQPSVTVAVQASITPVVEVPSATLESSAQPTADSTSTPVVDAQPVATSRGPELHATDPTTVSLAAGQLHFVEFFRFT
ncbi:MAG TPA: hypothetical protein VJM08_09120 [Anaerolineales bacterium]|nr:hypothetical protein [Anaerolineales bacterium]